jgi:hypothetical protein
VADGTSVDWAAMGPGVQSTPSYTVGEPSREIVMAPGAQTSAGTDVVTGVVSAWAGAAESPSVSAMTAPAKGAATLVVSRAVER